MPLVRRIKVAARRCLAPVASMVTRWKESKDAKLRLIEEEQAAARMEEIGRARPIQVNIETTTLCNARCTFCAYPKVSRPKSVMTMDVFEKICRDFEALGGGLLGLSPMMSDPLVDPFVLDRVRLVNEKFPKI